MNKRKNWLLAADCPAHLSNHNMLTCQSLTRYLRSLGAVFSVRLLHLGDLPQDTWFADVLPMPEATFGRDVLLCLNEVPVVWARSVCAREAQGWRGLLNCGERPLGERLFDGSLPLQRSPFEYAFTPDDLACLAGQGFAARRSVFTLADESLGLVECFLPALLRFTEAV